MSSNIWTNLGLLAAIISLVLLKLGESFDSSSDAGNYSDYYTGNASMKQLRFQHFEPRQHQQQQSHSRHNIGQRKGRGFHFHAADGDLSVEMEFIVPFVKVPVQRTMSMAREAVQSILNLRTGALINTAVVVAAGAIIAAVVRLLLAPLVITAYGNTNSYGYGRNDYAASNKQAAGNNNHNSSSVNRGMRRLTNAVEAHLSEHNIDASVCAQRYICQYLQRNAVEVRSPGQAQPIAGHAKLLDALSNLQWLDAYINGTAVFDAIYAARNRQNCAQIYRSCRWPQLSMQWKWLKAWPDIIQYFNG